MSQQRSVGYIVHKSESLSAAVKAEQNSTHCDVLQLAKAADRAIRSNDQKTAVFLIERVYATLDALFEGVVEERLP